MANNPSGSGIAKESHLSVLHNELSYSYLKEITKGFSEVIGEKDDLATVYKGNLDDGRAIAVKKHEGNAPGTRDIKAYRKNVLSIMQHRDNNVVNLLAFCIEVQKDVTVKTHTGYFTGNVVQTLFCYPYFPHGNLHNLLFGDPKRSINWSTRFKIIRGICGGLFSLHNAAGIIMHLNLKPQNILLDENMTPKITDFVYSRVVGGEEGTRRKTVSKLGPVGYKSPEYLSEGEISRKTDIYALGLMILEITTRERNSPSEKSESARDYINNVEKNWYLSESLKQTIMSRYLGLDPNAHLEVEHCIKIGLKCVSPAANDRPTIVEIVRALGA